MDAVNGATLRGICSSYFENHVSPVLRYIQQAQEQINTQLQDIRERSTRQADTIEELRRKAARKLDAVEDDSPGDAEDSAGRIRGGRRASTGQGPHRDGHGPLRDTPREGVSTLVRLQDLTAAVKTKADAKGVPTLAQFHKLETTVNQKANIKDLPADLVSILARKADVGSVPTLNQLQQIEQKIEELSASIQQKIVPQAYSLEGSEATSPEKTSFTPTSPPSPSPPPQALREPKDAAGGFPAAPPPPPSPQILDIVAKLELKVQEVAIRMDQKASLKDIPTAASLRTICAELVQASGYPAKAPAQAAADKPEEKSDMRKVQTIIAAAGVRFDKQIRDLREKVRKLEEDMAKRPSPPIEEADSDFSGRWPGRRLGPVSECDDIPDNQSDAGSIGAGSYAGSLAESVTAGLNPEEKAELRKIQAVVVAAGTAFSKELREVRRQMRELRDEMFTVTDRLGIKAADAGAGVGRPVPPAPAPGGAG